MEAIDIAILSSVSELVQSVLKELESDSNLGIAKQRDDDRELLVDTVILEKIRGEIDG